MRAPLLWLIAWLPAVGSAAPPEGEVAAVEALVAALAADPQQPALRRALRLLDPDQAEPAPPLEPLDLSAPPPPPLDPAAPAELLDLRRGVRIRADGRMTVWRHALLVARAPDRIPSARPPRGADILRLRRWPAAGGPPQPLTPAEAEAWATAPGDRLELAYSHDLPAQAPDGAVLRLREPLPIHALALVVALPAPGWRALGVGGAGAGEGGPLSPRWTLGPLPARAPAAAGAHLADWLQDEPAVLVGRAADEVAFAAAAAADAPVADPPGVLAAATLRTAPEGARIERLAARHTAVPDLAAALRVAGIEAWPVRGRARWWRARDALPLSRALLPDEAVWLPAQGRLLGPRAEALAGADAVVLDGSGRWQRLPAPERSRAGSGAVSARGPQAFVVRWSGAPPTGAPPAIAWGGIPLDAESWQAARRMWWTPAPARLWARFGAWALSPDRSLWLGPPTRAVIAYESDRAPPPIALEGPGGARFERRIVRRPEGFAVEATLILPGGLVDPAAQRAFLSFCAAVEGAQRPAGTP